MENNIYGVDLNEESIEIAKLSLWLRTAQPKRKLTSLNDNIKCGNSLIESKTVAGDKAFNWKEQFPEVFAKGGFDVVIGNPPYGAQFSKDETLYYNKIYKYQNYQLDSYLLFTEKLSFLLVDNGIASYIMPNTWLSSLFAGKIRNYVFNNFSVLEINHYSYFVFDDATVETDTYIFKKGNDIFNNEIKINIIEKDLKISNQVLLQKEIIEKEGKPLNIFEKKEFQGIKKKVSKLSKLGNLTQIVQGTKPFQKGKGIPKQTEQTLIDQSFVKETKIDESFRPLLRGSLINRYLNVWNYDYYISFGDWLAESRYSAKFDTNEKLIIRQTGDSLIATIDLDKFIARDNLYVIRDDENNFNLKYLLSVLNSKFLTWYFRKFINPEEGKAMAQVKRGHLIDLPVIKCLEDVQQPFIEKADLMLSLNKQLQDESQKFQRNLKREFSLEELPKKLQDWYLLSYGDFIKELTKKKVVLSLAQKAEWEEYFLSEAKKANDIKNEITKTDAEIDQMVYELYGLNEEEIKIVEGN